MGRRRKVWPGLIVLSSALNIPSSDPIIPRPSMLTLCPWLVAIAPFPIHRFPDKLAPNLPNNIPSSPVFVPLLCFLVFSLAPFINTPDSSSDLTIVIIYSFFYFKLARFEFNIF